MFHMKDNIIYDELWNVLAPLGTELKGEPVLVQDVFGWYLKDAEAVDEEVCLVYRCRQVDADKRAGSGEQILAGDRLYYYPSDGLVSPTATGAFGTDYYFCGWAKKDATALDAHVLMNFDGTRWDEDV